VSNGHEAPDGSGSLQPGRPPTNTSFNTPDTQRDRSNTVRVVQIIHSNIGLNLGLLDCPKRCRAEELTAAIVSSSYINVSHGTGGGIFTNFRHSVPVTEFLKSFNIGKIWIQVWWYCSIFDESNIYFNASIMN